LFVAILANVIQLGIVAIGSYYLSRTLARSLQQMEPQSKESKGRLEKILAKRRGGKKIKLPALTSHEAMIADDVVDPSSIDITFMDIGGLDLIKKELWQLAVLPLKRPDLFGSNKLVQPPRGILLYGKPGTGKTMLAKAIAKEAEATFVEVKLSKIMDKWFGESNKLIAATFGLAQKLAPSIIFIDELDTFLNPRDGFENSASATIKSEFLVLWDGMSTTEGILVLGATNRPHNVDRAILRRLPRSFAIPLPDLDGRKSILTLILKDQNMDLSAKRFIPELARRTVGYSGSDLKEMCRTAAMTPIQEIMSEASRRAVSGEEDMGSVLQAVGGTRALNQHDFEMALLKVKRTGQEAQEYGRQITREEIQEKESIGDEAKILRALFQTIRSVQTDTESDDEVPNLP